MMLTIGPSLALGMTMLRDQRRYVVIAESSNPRRLVPRGTSCVLACSATRIREKPVDLQLPMTRSSCRDS